MQVMPSVMNPDVALHALHATRQCSLQIGWQYVVSRAAMPGRSRGPQAQRDREQRCQLFGSRLPPMAGRVREGSRGSGSDRRDRGSEERVVGARSRRSRRGASGCKVVAELERIDPSTIAELYIG